MSACLLALVACGSESDGEGDPTPAPASSQAAKGPKESAQPDDAAKKAVLTAYRAMWTEQMKAYRKADEKGTDLEKYATLDALGKFRLDLQHMRDNGTVIKGDMQHHDTQVTGVDLHAKTPKAKLQDCIDLSKWKTWDLKEKKVVPLPAQQPLRYLATAKAEKWHGKWMITDYTPNGERSC